jgi:hypothetical protein
MNDYMYYEARGIDYRGQLKKIKKHSNYLQPIFEALTNSLEAIKSHNNKFGKINIILNFGGNLFSNDEDVRILQSIQIIDNGIGFTDKEFDRLKNIHDDSKGISNKGSGRLQFIHFFEEAIYESVYIENKLKTGFYKRFFKLSKSEDCLLHHAILCYKEPISIKNENKSDTTLTLKNLLDDNDKKLYSTLTPTLLKEEILNRYLEYFAANRETLPTIIFGTDLSEDIERITSDDIIAVDKEVPIKINYKLYDGKNYIQTDNFEEFTIKAFVINQELLSENSLKLTSKQEIVTAKSIVESVSLDILKPTESINSNRYLFLISGDYIDSKDSDNRGELELYNEKEAKKTLNKDQEIILLDDIHNHVNSKILSMYNEIAEKKIKHEENLEKLRKMFLLNKETLKNVKITINDTDENILKKVYKADVTIIAEKDAKIKEKIEQLDTLDLSYVKQEDYHNQLNQQIEELVEVIPLQNRTALTHAVARRKLVLDLFDKVLNRSLDKQNSGNRNIDEELLHNLIFKQKSNNPDESDLWLISEDYIYFKGVSESRLDNIEINGEKLFKDDSELSKEAIEYKKSLNEDRDAKKTDILLFPEEGKCIIIEFKNPNVNVAKHLTQVNHYAALIWNFSKDKYKFHTFYTYLIGEKINTPELRTHDPEYREASGFDYWYKPASKVAGIYVDYDADIYSEVIKFSTLVERAKLRNKHYIDKLLGDSIDE